MQQKEWEKASLQAFVCSSFFSLSAKPLLLNYLPIFTKIEVLVLWETIFNKALAAFKFHKKNYSEK